MAGRFKVRNTNNQEFELDLAPLLSVMVKLVPVLLISSAFVQMMIIETELPQVVQQAIQDQDKNPKAPQVTVEINKKDGVKIIVNDQGQEKVEVVALTSEKQFNYSELHAKFQEVKKAYPQVFKIEFNPDGNVSYKDVVKVMDEARRARDKNVRFPVKDTKTGQDTTTEYMFPEVVFANMMDG